MIAVLSALLVAGTVRADDTANARVFALPQGGELLVVSSPDAENVGVGLHVPGGWASPGAGPYAREAWESPVDAQTDLRQLQFAAPGLMVLRMEADHALLWVTGEDLDEGFATLAEASVTREHEFGVRYSGALQGGAFRPADVLWSELTGNAPSEKLEDVESSDLTAEVSRRTRAPGRVLVVVGDVEPDDALALARRVLPPAREEGPPPAVSPLTWPDGDRVVHRSEVVNTWQTWAWPTVAPKDSRAPAAKLLWQLVQARVWTDVRESNGLTYHIESSESVGLAGTVCHLAIETPQEHAAKTRDLVDGVVQALATTPPSTAEVERARGQLLGPLATGQHGIGHIAQELATTRIRTGRWQTADEQVAELAGVDAAAVQALAATWLTGKERAYVRVEP